MVTKCTLDAGSVCFIEHALAKLERDLESADGSASEALMVVHEWLGDVQLAQGAAPQIVGAPLRVTTRVLDVADRAAMFDWAAETVAQHGCVNLVFNNAGVALSSTIDGMEYADLEWIVGINFWGVVHGTKAFLPYLKASGAGHIVNTSSVFGLFAQPGMSGYNATKFAIEGLSEGLWYELGTFGIKVKVIEPGAIKTDFGGRSQDVWDVSRVPAYAPFMNKVSAVWQW